MKAGFNQTMVFMPRLFHATLALAALAACGAQAADGRMLPAGSYEVAQASDPRVFQLEEEVRLLNGRIEELSFQLLEMQEQLRRMQEDNEFRFQMLEGGDAAPDDRTMLSPDQPGDAPDQAIGQSPEAVAAAPAQPTIDEPATPPATIAEAGAAPAAPLGTGPRDLGTLTIDGAGNVVDFSKEKLDSAIDGGSVASVAAPDDPEAYYREGYRLVLDGDYSVAEDIFRSFVELFPNDPLQADARFWLAESVRAQGRLQEAAESFIALRRDHPDMRKAPETMLKIGQIMYELGDRDVACVTYADAEANYPGMSDAVRSHIRAERAKAQC